MAFWAYFCRYRRLILLLCLPLTTVLGGSCVYKRGTSGISASQAGQAFPIIQMYRRIIGRDPSAQEIAEYLGKPYEQQVDQLFKSNVYEREGYFNLHRERLLLNKEGTSNWINVTQPDYCSLKFELEDQSRVDRDGSGYWDILHYRERWVPYTGGSSEALNSYCLQLSKVSDLIWAVDNGVMTDTVPNNMTFEQEEAYYCMRQLKNDQPPFLLAKMVSDFNDFPGFVNYLKNLPDDKKSKPIIYLPIGVKVLAQVLNKRFLRYPSGDENEDGGDGEAVTGPQLAVVVDNSGAPVTRMVDLEGIRHCQSKNYRLDQVIPSVLEMPFDLGDGEEPEPEEEDQQVEVDKPVEVIMYVKVRVPEFVQGVHANTYWLKRHPTKEKNKHLHRARLLYFSYFCTEIAPDMASFSGGLPQVIPELKPFFAENDVHKDGSASCYNCHAIVQPLANFFGRLSHGSNYMEENFLQDEGWFDRPGGLWDGQALFPLNGKDRGMEGLAALLEKHPKAQQCITDFTWYNLVGKTYPMSDKERTAAMAAFNQSGTPRISKLLKHFLVDSSRGRAYFTKGENQMSQMPVDGTYSCPNSYDEPASIQQRTDIGKICSSCHRVNSPKFVNQAKLFDVDHYFTSEPQDVTGGDTPQNRGNFWHSVYCRIKNEEMPPPTAPRQFTDEGKNAALCYIKHQINRHADSGAIPAEFKNKLCDGEEEMPDSNGHVIVGTKPTPTPIVKPTKTPVRR